MLQDGPGHFPEKPTPRPQQAAGHCRGEGWERGWRRKARREKGWREAGWRRGCREGKKGWREKGWRGGCREGARREEDGRRKEEKAG